VGGGGGPLLKKRKSLNEGSPPELDKKDKGGHKQAIFNDAKMKKGKRGVYCPVKGTRKKKKKRKNYAKSCRERKTPFFLKE